MMLNNIPYQLPQRGGEPTHQPKCWLSRVRLLPFGEVGKGFFFIFFLLFISACKKEKPPSTPGAITGPKNLCPAELGVTYSTNPVEDATFYLWTVPDDAKIISGQGTTSIVINFGQHSGSICVRANNSSEESNASCMDVAQGGVSNSWCRELNFKGGARTEAIGFSIGNKGYVGTGLDVVASHHNDFWEYDPALDTWTQKENFGGVARFDAVGFSIGNKGYIGTGYVTTSYLKDFWEYDPILNLWQQKADCAGPPRGFAFGFSIGNKGYIGSGSDALFSTLTDFYEYDPALDQWTKKADVVPRNVGSVFSIGDKGYLGTGTDGTAYFNDFWEYDPNDSSNGFDTNNKPLGKWNQKATFPGASRYAAVGFSIGDKGYIGTGYDGTDYYNDFYEYNPASNSWIQKSNFVGESRAYAVGFAIGKNGYIGIGTNIDGPLLNFWVYGQ